MRNGQLVRNVEMRLCRGSNTFAAGNPGTARHRRGEGSFHAGGWRRNAVSLGITLPHAPVSLKHDDLTQPE